MTTAELIASGLLEAYVLGEGTPEERALVERMRVTDALVKAELEAIEEALEAHARANAVAPPVRARAAILTAIGGADERIRPLAPAPARSSFNWLAAASIGALLVSAAGNWFLYGELRGVRDRLAVLEDERAIMAQEMEVQRTALKESQTQLAVILDPHKRMVSLAGQALDPKAAARVFYDPVSHEVYLDVLSLPMPPAGKQYQLWAQIDGRMVDAGVFDMGTDSLDVHRMKDAPNATAFGVTLEEMGGSETPTLSALYLLGAVS